MSVLNLLSLTVSALVLAQTILLVQGQSFRCVTLSSPLNGRVRYSRTSLTVGTRATFSCNFGYRVSGSRSRTCQSSGFWSGSSARCVREGCSQLFNPANGRVRFSSASRNVGSTATYSCNSGYTLSGSRSRTCFSSGRWSGFEPRCRRSSCSRLSSPLNGHVSYSTFSNILRVGTRATYSCNFGYTLSGSSTRTCLSSGWSGVGPRCAGSQSGAAGALVGTIIGPLFGIGFMIVICCCVVAACIIKNQKSNNNLRNRPIANVTTPNSRPNDTHFNLQPRTTVTPVCPSTYTLQLTVTPTPVPTNLEPQPPSSEVTLPNSELQEQPPPDYSTAVRYLAYEPKHSSQEPPAYKFDEKSNLKDEEKQTP